MDGLLTNSLDVHHPDPSLLKVDWICSGLSWGGWVPWVEGGKLRLHMTPHGPGWAKILSTPASFAQHIEHNCTLDRSVMTRCTPVSHSSGTVLQRLKLSVIQVRSFHTILKWSTKKSQFQRGRSTPLVPDFRGFATEMAANNNTEASRFNR
jgi:hypothetical protein